MTTRLLPARSAQPMLALLVGAAITFGMLCSTRPALSGDPASWTGDDLAITALWWAAVIATAWLTVTTLLCVAAVARGNVGVAHRVARFAPPLVRHALQAALVSTWVLVPTTAYAASPSAPITVHVDARGHLTTEDPRASIDDVPIVRTPATTPRTSRTTTPETTHSPTTIPPPPIPPNPTTTAPLVAPLIAPRHTRATAPVTNEHTAAPVAAPTARRRVHIVKIGDNLWAIASAEVSRVTGVAHPDDARIAPYWRRVIAANRATLHSGDPNLIFRGEVIALPNAV